MLGDPVNLVDPSGLYVETGVDVAFVVYDITTLALGCGNWDTLGLDAAGIFLPGIAGLGHTGELLRAARAGGEAERGGLNLYKWNHPTSTAASGWREGDRMLTVPWKGSPKGTWAENASRLRTEMRSDEPIYETYVDSAGNLIATKGFLNAERNLLRNRGWQYDPGSRAWTPPR